MPISVDNVHDFICIIFEFKWTHTMKMCMWKRAMSADLQVVTKHLRLTAVVYTPQTTHPAISNQ